jgi:hypothetical protein
MSIPAWLNLGVVTGIIGSVAGIAGAVMGFVSYRRVSRMKALDLRLEVRKLKADCAGELRELPDLMTKANDSRMAVAAAAGWLNSGAIQVWKDQLKQDQASVQALDAGPDLSAAEYRKVTQTQLEERLVELHGLHREIRRYIEKYRAALAADDKEREHIRADRRLRSYFAVKKSEC